MEKLAYALWKGDTTADEFRDRLLAKLPTRLPTLGAESLAICAVDSDVARGAALHLGTRKPDALVTFWLECSQDRAPLEEHIAWFSERMAGYLMVESRPLVFESPAPPGERLPGFNLVGFVLPKPGITHQEFLTCWNDVHRNRAVRTLSSFSYVCNEVVRPLTDDAPPWVAIVEESFSSAALDDPTVFFGAPGSEARYQANFAHIAESSHSFLDMQNLESHPMSEYRF